MKKQFKNTFKFSNKDTNKLFLLSRKGMYSYEYMDDWEKFNETTLSGKEEFYTNLSMEDITDADYIHTKCLLADVFKNLRKMCFKVYHLDLVKFLSVPGLVWQVALKNTKVK